MALSVRSWIGKHLTSNHQPPTNHNKNRKAISVRLFELRPKPQKKRVTLLCVVFVHIFCYIHIASILFLLFLAI